MLSIVKLNQKLVWSVIFFIQFYEFDATNSMNLMLRIFANLLLIFEFPFEFLVLFEVLSRCHNIEFFHKR